MSTAYEQYRRERIEHEARAAADLKRQQQENEAARAKRLKAEEAERARAEKAREQAAAAAQAQLDEELKVQLRQQFLGTAEQFEAAWPELLQKYRTAEALRRDDAVKADLRRRYGF